ncbi:MAG: hypothetical protein HYR70_07695 [Chloroflexi bacterium]|nr:hypothetical protein [Chloroflexota bacterium]MBI3341441.1 hypothetical protein [Chloroflexota bacterium]
MRTVAVILAVLTGLIVLLGYFFPVLSGVQTVVLSWTIILAGTATVVGVFSLILVHFNKVTRREKGSVYSVLLLMALFVTFIFGITLGPDDPNMQLLVNAIIVPVESTLMALLAVTLLYAGVRLLRRRTDLMSVIFLLTAAFMLFASATLPFGEISLLNNWIRPWVQQVLALGGARGILIGVALGTLTTGLRILFGADRPYGGK